MGTMVDSYGISLGDIRDEKRRGLPLYPYQGVYGITCREGLRKALLAMGIPRGPMRQHESPGWCWFGIGLFGDVRIRPKGTIPWLVHYDYLNPERYEAYAETDFANEKRKGYVRIHKRHLSIGRSPYHAYKCVHVDVAWTMFRRRQEREVEARLRDKRARSEIPSEIKVEKDILATQSRMGVFEDRHGIRKLQSYKALWPSGKRVVVEEKLVLAYEYRGEWRVVTRTPGETDGGLNWYHRAPDGRVIYGDQKTPLKFGLAGACQLVPSPSLSRGHTIRAEDLDGTRIRRLCGKEIRRLLTRDVLVAYREEYAGVYY